MENMIEIENKYQGVTYEEMVALSHVFDKTVDIETLDQFPDLLLQNGETE